MKHISSRYITIALFMQCLLFLPGCTLVEWGNVTFRQAETVSGNFSESMKPFIKSIVVYDQFASIAEFSALFLTDEARMIYADYFFHRNFKTQEEQDISRQRLLTENDYYITFYVIGYQPATIYASGRGLFSGEYQVQGPLLGSADANWKISLLVDGKEYGPCDIRSVQLPAEYQHFFGIHWSQFKSAYKVRFDFRDQNGHEILPAGHHHVSLKFSSVVYSAILEWRDVVYQLEARDNK